MFVDIRPDTLNLDESLVEAAVTRDQGDRAGPLRGVGCEMDALRRSRRGTASSSSRTPPRESGDLDGRPLGGVGDLGA